MELKNVEIIRIGKLKTFDSGWKMVEFHVKTDEAFPQVLNLQINKEKADAFILYNKVGDKVDCSLNIKGREWTDPKTKEVALSIGSNWSWLRWEKELRKCQLLCANCHAIFHAGDRLRSSLKG